MTPVQYMSKALDEVVRLEHELGEGDLEYEIECQLTDLKHNQLPRRESHDSITEKLRRIAQLAQRAADFYEACPCK